MADDVIDAYPHFLNRPIDLVVDERPIQTRITAAEWMDCWRPLLQHIMTLHLARPKRILIGVGGPPGAGKSVFAAQLHWIVSRNVLKHCHAAALSMDGFHYDSNYLREHFRANPAGQPVPLSQYKGAPDTFDIAAMKKMLETIRACQPDVRWPAYSRQIHDVIPGRHPVMPSANIVVVEGNYMLVDRGPFRGIPALFDLGIYIDSPAAVIISTLMARHTSSGKAEMIAKEWVKTIDLPNARLAESTRPQADVVIERSSEGEMVGLEWKEKAVPRPKAV